MAASYNRIVIVGNLGRDPEMRFLPSGTAICKLSVATTDKWKNRDGEAQEKTDWHSVSVFGKQGESCGSYLHKGSAVLVEGSLHYSEYEKDGVKRTFAEVKADKVQFLGGGRGEQREVGGFDNQGGLVDGEEAPF